MIRTPGSVVDDEERIDAPPVPWMHGAAGIAGGALSMTMFYPLDFLRTRMHTYNGKNRIKGLQEIVQHEGMKGMYRGVGVAVASHSLGWGTYLTLFRIAQGNLNGRWGGSSTSSDVVSAIFAACITATAVTPLNLLKTRKQLANRGDGSQLPKGICNGLRYIVRTEGSWAVLRGVGPQILLSMNTTIQVAMYECMKREFWGDASEVPVTGVVAVSALSKSFASAVCNPLEVIRTRLQDAKNAGQGGKYSSMGQAFQTLWKEEGMRGMYRGVFVNVCRVIPTTVVAFVMYESILKLIHAGATKSSRPAQKALN